MDDFLKSLRNEMEKLDLAAKLKLERNPWAPVTKPVEETFLLRLPEQEAKVLNDNIDKGTQIPLSLTLDEEGRKGTLNIFDKTLHARVGDLPTFVEAQKVYEHYGLYKTANISQMVICTEDKYVPPNGAKTDDYKLQHGLTPCLKNVRKHRFRKTANQELAKSFAREDELKRILLRDSEAVKVSYKVYQEEPNELSYVATDEESEMDSDFSYVDTSDEEEENFTVEFKVVPPRKKELETEIEQLEKAVNKLTREKELKSRAIVSTDNPIMKKRLHSTVQHLIKVIPEKEHELEMARKKLKRF